MSTPLSFQARNELDAAVRLQQEQLGAKDQQIAELRVSGGCGLGLVCACDLQLLSLAYCG